MAQKSAIIPEKVEFCIDWGLHALLKLIETYEFTNVLDIGSGAGQHKSFLEHAGKEVVSVDFSKEADYQGDFMELDLPQFDAIWCSHVLEHQRNVGRFLEKVKSHLKTDGVLALIVPGHSQDRLVAGHLTAWSVPLLVYNLVLAGFDCSDAKILCSHELSILMKKKDAVTPFVNSCIGEEGDMFKSIRDYFPFPIQQGMTMTGPGSIDWGDPYPDLDLGSKIESRFLENEISV